ncbi:MAG: M16 family metallopeptidase [Gemmobacter sp.]
MLRAVLTCLALIAALPAAAERVTGFTLSNGLEAVVIEDPRAPVVVHMVWYRVGAADEVPGKSGLAHYLEHLMFKGTETTGPGEFSALVEAQGGSDNAFTSWDYTGYFQRVASDRLPLVMAMEADRMANLRIPEDEALTERAVVLEERAQRVEASPGGLFGEQRRAAQFLNHPYGRPIIGWRHEIEALTPDDARAFYARHYGPNNAVLIVAGDVTADAVRALAEEHYGPIPANPRIQPRQRPAEPPQLAERRVMMADARVGEPYVVRTYLAPTRRAGDQREAAALTVLAELLGGNPATSVLGRALQFDRQVAVQVDAFYDSTALDASTFTLAVVPAPGVTLAEGEAALDAALADFLAQGVDQAAFERILRQLRAAEIYALDNADRRARRYGEGLTTGLTIDDIRDWPAVLQSVTPAEVMAAARGVLDRSRAVTGHLDRKDAS